TMRDLLLEQVRQAKARGQAVLFSSHVLGEVERVCDRVLLLRQGQLVHVQDMRHLQAGRLVHAVFAGPAPAPPALAGLPVRSQRGDRLALEFTGELSELLGWLSGRPLVELRIEPLGLDAVYHRYHGAPS